MDIGPLKRRFTAIPIENPVIPTPRNEPAQKPVPSVPSPKEPIKVDE
jgi:hypothetical protein